MTTAAKLAAVYDEIADQVVALVSSVVPITEIHRGFPRFAISTFTAPSAYIYFTGAYPARAQDTWSTTRISWQLAVTAFLTNEKQLLDFLGAYEDSDLCDSNILSGTYRVDFTGISRIQAAEGLPINADYGATINIAVIL